MKIERSYNFGEALEKLDSKLSAVVVEKIEVTDCIH